jgi:hypothetical protein
VEEIMQAVAIMQAGDRQQAREQLLELWEIWSEKDAPRECCTIAHFLADTEGDPRAELEWDLRALEAVTGARDPVEHGQVAAGLESFLPSLHLNAGDAWRRVGEPSRAKCPAEIGLAHAHALNGDGYGDMIKAGLERLRSQLNTAS